MNNDFDLMGKHAVSWPDYIAAGALSMGLIGTAIYVTPQASAPALMIPGFMSTFGGAMVVINLVLAVLLFSKGAIARQAAPIRLATAYLYSALIILPHLAAMPGAIMATPIIGTSASAVWLWSFWHTGFALLIMRYALLADRQVRAGSIIRTVLSVIVLVGTLTAIATYGLPYLPPVLVGNTYFTTSLTAIVPVTVLTSNLVALALVPARMRLRSAQDLWLTIAMLAASVDVWLTYCAGSRFTLGWYTSRCASLITCTVVLVWLFRDITVLFSRVALANKTLADLARLDGLTGLANRRALDEVVLKEWRRALRELQPLSFVLFDVDHFKLFNDRYGHPEGDECLRRVSERLRAVARRPADAAARYGGEEFALVLPMTDLSGAIQLADEARRAVRSMAIPHAGTASGIVTISVGVATTVPHPDQSVGTLIAAADAALYIAKVSGRDRVHSEQPVEPALGVRSMHTAGSVG